MRGIYGEREQQVRPGSDPPTRSGKLICIFWPVTSRNYYLWPFLFLIPLMIGDVVTTTFALDRGYSEINPLMVVLAEDPFLHLGLKIILPVLLLFLCIYLYSAETRGYPHGPDPGGTLVRSIKLTIFIVILIDCIIYAGAFTSNSRILLNHVPG